MPQTPSAGGAPPAPTIPVFACGEPEEQPQGRGQCNFVGLYDWQAKLAACAAEVAWQGGRHSYNETAVERYVPRSHAETGSEGTYDYRDRSLWVRESIIIGGGTKLFAVVAHEMAHAATHRLTEAAFTNSPQAGSILAAQDGGWYSTFSAGDFRSERRTSTAEQMATERIADCVAESWGARASHNHYWGSSSCPAGAMGTAVRYLE